jgi:hypothetical protein
MRLRWKIMRLVNLTVVITLFLATLNISIALSMSETQEANETVIEMDKHRTPRLIQLMTLNI